MRILVVKTSSMGDVVHALPVVEDLRRLQGAGPAWTIDWLVEPAFAALPESHPGIDRVHRLPWRRWRKGLLQPATWRAMGELRRTLRQRRYDLIIDLQGLLKSAVWARLARSADSLLVGYDRCSIREPLAARLYDLGLPVSQDSHAIERCRRLAVQAIEAHRADSPSIQPPVTQPPLAPAEFGLEQLSPLTLEGLNAPYAVLIPNASRPEKYWPLDRWQAVGRELAARGWQVVVLWGSADQERMAREIAQGCEGWVPPFLTVAQAIRLLAGAQVAVGLDTGFSHIAAAVGRPVVGIYCDHEPGLTGITGSGPGASLGGKGLSPSLEAVQAAVQQVLQRSSIRCGG